ncbi:MAG: hypothetical protein JXA54_05735 [Candidatus Heimdallarchaeota archaeon]|nr:hypothetical protein [Candidatus Heimdallarchaeota archaeon]
MDLYSDNFTPFAAPSAIEINVRPNLLYTEEYSYLTRDELEVLFLLATTEMSAEGLTSFSFSGIKRQLGKHQQKITKAVNRLLSKDLITKTNIGYSISQKGSSILSEVIKSQNAIDLHQSNNEFLQQKLLFNYKVALDEIANLLIGKWFGSFRYISHTEGKNLTIRWQLVDSRSSATLQVYNDEAIITVIPETNNHQKFTYEQAMNELSQYFCNLVNALGIQPNIVFQGWKRNTFSEIEYQQRLLSWLNTSNKTLAEN